MCVSAKLGFWTQSKLLVRSFERILSSLSDAGRCYPSDSSIGPRNSCPIIVPLTVGNLHIAGKRISAYLLPYLVEGGGEKEHYEFLKGGLHVARLAALEEIC